jgi:hypothetical protein
MPSEKTRFFLLCGQCGERTREIVRNGADSTILPCFECDPTAFDEFVHPSDRLATESPIVPPPVIKNGEPLPNVGFGYTFDKDDNVKIHEVSLLPECPHSTPTECGSFTNEHVFPMNPPTVENYIDALFASCPNADPEQIEAVKKYLNEPVDPNTGKPPDFMFGGSRDYLADWQRVPDCPTYESADPNAYFLGAKSEIQIDGETIPLDGFARMDFILNNPLTPDRIIDIAKNHGAQISTTFIPSDKSWKCAARFVGLATHCDADADFNFICKYDGGKNPVFPPFTLEAGLCSVHCARLTVGSTRDVSIGFKVKHDPDFLDIVEQGYAANGLILKTAAEIDKMNELRTLGLFRDLSDEQLVRLIRADGKSVDSVAREIAIENAPKRAAIQKFVNILSDYVRRQENATRATREAMAALSVEDVERLSVCRKEKSK